MSHKRIKEIAEQLMLLYNRPASLTESPIAINMLNNLAVELKYLSNDIELKTLRVQTEIDNLKLELSNKN